MAKGQRRSNREIRKPKKTKAPVAASATFMPKGLGGGAGPAKKK